MSIPCQRHGERSAEKVIQGETGIFRQRQEVLRTKITGLVRDTISVAEYSKERARISPKIVGIYAVVISVLSSMNVFS